MIDLRYPLYIFLVQQPPHNITDSLHFLLIKAAVLKSLCQAALLISGFSEVTEGNIIPASVLKYPLLNLIINRLKLLHGIYLAPARKLLCIDIIYMIAFIFRPSLNI